MPFKSITFIKSRGGISRSTGGGSLKFRVNGSQPADSLSADGPYRLRGHGTSASIMMIIITCLFVKQNK